MGWQPFVPDPDNAGVGKRIHELFPFKAAFRGLLYLVEKGDNVRIFVNGEEQTIESTSVLGYLKEIEIDPQRVAVELNLYILPKGEYDTTQLKDGDRIEIVHFVGGG